MDNVTLETFNEAVLLYFEPIAHTLALPLSHPKEDLYEITSEHFVTRIRFCVGHGKSILVTLMETKGHANIDDDSEEYGVGLIAALNGEQVTPGQVSERDAFMKGATKIAKLTERYACPYLLGQKSDFSAIREYAEHLIAESGVREKEWHFPENVREEWHLPESEE